MPGVCRVRHARTVGDHEEGVGYAPRGEGHAAGSDEALVAVDVDEDLTFEDVDGLVGLGMAVQRRGLALRHDVLEQEERAVGVFGRELPGVEAAAEEGPLVAFAGGSDDRNWCAHGVLPLSFMGLKSHDERTVPSWVCQSHTS